MNRQVDQQRERFESLYDDRRLHVLGYCMRRAQPSDARDACSESFLVAWRRIDEIPEPPKTLPYLYGIAGKVLANQARTLRRRSRLDAKLKHLGIAPAADPSALVLRNSRYDEVLAALDKLKPRDREILMLYNWEELSREAIAEMMDMTKAAVDQRIHRSYKRLARILRPTVRAPQFSSTRATQEGPT